jgi:hypothetical protein
MWNTERLGVTPGRRKLCELCNTLEDLKAALGNVRINVRGFCLSQDSALSCG